MNTQLPGPRHARADVGRAHRGRSLLAATAASLVALTGLSGIALASDGDETPTPSTSASSSQIGATEGAHSDETQPTGDAGTISSGTAGGSSAAPEESASANAPAATADTDVAAAGGSEAATPTKAPTSIQARDVQVQPLSAGPDGPGVTTPYVYWTVTSASGTLVGGATFQIQGPRNNAKNDSNATWANNATVVDNTGQPSYSGTDLDPDPGEFLVKIIGTHSISASYRYRVQQSVPPSGYGFAAGTNWITIPGNRQDPSNSAWSNSTYNFGKFVVVARGAQAPVCSAGYVYAVSSAGQIQQVSPSGIVTTLGSSAYSVDSSVDSFNGLGIGAGGQPVYGYQRYNGAAQGNAVDGARIWVFDTSSGTWSYTEDFLDTGLANSLVAGAVDLSTGKYLFGGFTSDGEEFKIWQYNPGETPRFTYKGFIDTSHDAGSASNNGDMAFDSEGNLFVVRGTSSSSGGYKPTYIGSTTVFSVDAKNIDAASGVLIDSSYSNTVQTGSSTTQADVSVNGVAFDANGKAYLGTSSKLTSYDMPNWSNGASALAQGSSFSSTDLASCGSPPTITLQKSVSGRVSTTDQFGLALSQGSTSLGMATTTGTATGLQSAQVGPQPTVRGAVITFSETAAGTTFLSNYASAYSCAVDGVTIPGASGTGRSGTVTIPTSGQAVVCQFTNSPLVANVTINKQMQDINGANPQPQQGWTVGAAMTQTSGTVTSTNPTATTLPTGSDGSASWTITFGSSSSAAMVAVHEEQRTGYDFVSGSCTVTSLSGIETTTSLSGPTTQNLTGIVPGDQVNCTYTNKPSSATLTLVKNVINSHNGSALPTSWSLSATMDGGSAPTISGSTGSAEITGAVVPLGVYNLSESTGPTGYEASAWSCVNATTSGSKVTLVANSNVTCTITNSDLPGSVTWSKTDTSSPANLLAGSVWTLTGPKTSDNQPGPSVDVEDCVAGSNSACTGQDKNPVAGKFLVTSLSWGSYTLIEKAAPAGYLLDPTPQNFTIKGDALTYSFVTAFKNKQVTPPSLPLTGGLGTDTFLLAGGGLLALAGIGGWIHRRRSLRVQRA